MCMTDVYLLWMAPEDPQGGEVPTRGIMVIEVDDILEAGDEVHRQKMQWLENKLRFGKVENLQINVEGSGYAGRRLKQNQDFSFEYHMTDYINNRLKPIQFDRKFYKKDTANEKLNQEEEQQLRGIIAAINWVAREGRPDASASASILSGIFSQCGRCKTPWKLTTSSNTAKTTRSPCVFILSLKRTSGTWSSLMRVSMSRER